MVFVGTEIHQNTVAIQGTTRNELASGARDMLVAFASSPELSSIWRRWLAGEELSDDESTMAPYWAATRDGFHPGFVSAFEDRVLQRR